MKSKQGERGPYRKTTSHGTAIGAWWKTRAAGRVKLWLMAEFGDGHTTVAAMRAWLSSTDPAAVQLLREVQSKGFDAKQAELRTAEAITGTMDAAFCTVLKSQLRLSSVRANACMLSSHVAADPCMQGVRRRCATYVLRRMVLWSTRRR